MAQDTYRQYEPEIERYRSQFNDMIDKTSGRIAYALMSFGGFLGIGERYSPLPWNSLKYDTRQGGYVVGISKEVLKRGPSVGPDEEPPWSDRQYGDALHAWRKQR